MMRLLRRTSLLVAFYLLASAATASAECAWVLWAKFYSGISDKEEWQPIETTGTKPDCTAYQTRFFAALKATGWKQSFEETELPLRNPKNVNHLLLTGICLPDTIDPRGLKAK